MGIKVTGLADLQKFATALQQLEQHELMAANRAMEDIKTFGVARCQANAPIFKKPAGIPFGPYLREGIEATETVITETGVHADIVSVAVSAAGEDYAYEMHQFQVPAGSKYGLGPYSVNEKTYEGDAGGGYLVRAMLNELNLDKFISEYLKESVQYAMALNFQ